jgi:hypothetical protein
MTETVMIHVYTLTAMPLPNGAAVHIPTPGCKKPAYRYAHRPVLGERSDAKLITSHEGASNFKPVRCLSCGLPVGPAGSEPQGGWHENQPSKGPADPGVVDSTTSPEF